MVQLKIAWREIIFLDSGAGLQVYQEDYKLLDLNDILIKQFDEHKFNCWHLCQEVAQRIGFELISFNNWIENISQRDVTIRTFEKDFIRLDGPEPGAIVIFAKNNKTVVHMGIVLPDRKSFIHIGRKIRTPRIERLDDSPFTPVLAGYYRYAEPAKNQQPV